MRPRRPLTVPLGVVALGGALAPPAGATFAGANGRISFDRAVPAPGRLPGGPWAIGRGRGSIGSDGSAAALLQGGPRTQSDATWSPDGRRLAFQMETTARRNGPTEIAVMNADGSGVVQVTRLSSDSIAASWTPDGRILFSSDYESKRGYKPRRNGPPPPFWVYVVKADGSGLQRCVRTRRGLRVGECVDPVMAPDGSRIALNCVTFGARAPLNSGIYLTGPGGGAITRLSPNGGPDEINPGWSPDSRRLAFETGPVVARRPGGRTDIAVMDADGSGVRRIAATKWFETNPVFSPVGTKLVFTSDRDTRPRTPRGRPPQRLNPGFELYTVKLDGTGVTRLTTNRSSDVFPDWGVAPAP